MIKPNQQWSTMTNIGDDLWWLITIDDDGRWSPVIKDNDRW